MGRPAEAKMRVEKEFGIELPKLLKDLYIDKNMHSSTIAEIFNISPATVVSWCHELGIPVKPKGGRIDVHESKYSKIIKLYESGQSSTEIAKNFNCTGGTIAKILNENDVEIRGCRERFKRKYTLDERYFQNIDTPMKAYFLGWAMSDGSVGYNVANGCRYKLKIKADDVEILKEFKKQLHYDFHIITEINNRTNPAKTIIVYSVAFVEDLMSHGVIPNKSTIMTKPISVPYELEGHFVRGYFDGDGCVTRSHKGTNFLKIEYCGNISMMEWIAASIENHTGIPKNKICARNSYFATLSYSCSKVPAIRDFMYPSGVEFGLRRKKDLLFAATDKLPIVDFIVKLMKDINLWEGTATELYDSFIVIANRNKINKCNMPKSLSYLTRLLRQHETELNENNIITEYRKMPGGIRCITLKRF